MTYFIINGSCEKLWDIFKTIKEGTRFSTLHKKCSYPCHSISKSMMTFDMVIPFEEKPCPDPLYLDVDMHKLTLIRASPCNKNVIFHSHYTNLH